MLCRADKLLDALHWELKIHRQESLARFLQLDSSVLSRLRSNDYTLTPLIVLRIHEATGWPVSKIKELAGYPTNRFYVSPDNGEWKI